MEKPIDVAIIGGGPAGLNAALVLGRARRTVVVIDDGRPRNKVTREVHNFLTRDGIPPSEFRRIAREQMERYPHVGFVQDTAVNVTGADGDFRVTTEQGTFVRSKKLLFALGMKDVPLPIEGLAEVYGISAFVCPYCDGWEHRDKPVALIANGEGAMHAAKTIAGWTSTYVICANGPAGLNEAQRRELMRRRIHVFESRIARIESIEGQVQRLVLADGTVVACKAILFSPMLVAGSRLPQALGCQVLESGAVLIDDIGRTNVPGVYSAGDVATKLYQAVTAASMGSIAAIGINSDLLDEAWVSDS
ncbi:NAD(P)/FAD-dependent oxidoreductase [Cohnella panacarvi]|uniref:NAD(P)/FAD-dependent oxidoreductase n=1 Tax=Cohnella panacarvi TaxID=400776 RepID=UPI00047A03B9|nr:NAD(P)/FAD-dependent oxidoreductase [Cohnella panacarvi]